MKNVLGINTFADARLLTTINRLKWKLNGAFQMLSSSFSNDQTFECVMY